MRSLLLAVPVALLAFTMPARACFVGTPDVWCGGGSTRAAQPSRHHKRASRRSYRGLGGINWKLGQAFRFVSARCAGTSVVSGVRRTYIAGSRRRSLHWTGNALDFRASNYNCAYRALRAYGWRWGMSRDAWRCRHIHISYGGRHREPHGFRHRYC